MAEISDEELAALTDGVSFVTTPGGAWAKLQLALTELQARRAAEAAQPGEEWQPIDTAPKDRGAILVWCPERKNIYVVCWWQGYRGDPGWCHFGGGSGALSETPTHWQPLPSSPTALGARDD